MAKRKYLQPMLLDFTPFDPGDDEEEGDGTGQSGQLPFPCKYSEWLSLFSSDVNGDNVINEDDYTDWMTNHGWAGNINIDS